ncbi:MAG: helix-turn-helix domain-containing protein [Acidobacteria bacterium]|nr:helix-turn-helix domain-containing protein [Acidobacteriota bacterium]
MKDQLDRLIAQMVDEGVFFQDAVSEFEKRYIRRVMEINGGNQSQTAKALGIHRNTLGRKAEEYKLVGRNGARHPKSKPTKK